MSGGWGLAGLKGQSWEPIENRFAGLEGLEAGEPRGLEARRQAKLGNLTADPGSL